MTMKMMVRKHNVALVMMLMTLSNGHQVMYVKPRFG